jgi:putative spermidine/putrescine transport system permease protein
MWQDLEGKLDVTTAAMATVLIALTPVAMVVMDRLVGLSRRIN